MTGFSTPFFKSASLRSALATLLLGLWAWIALADGIQAVSGALTEGEEAYVLNAEFDIAVNPTLEEALAKGLPLYFVTELEVVRPRWYWLDEKVLSYQQTSRLSYNALTRQYRLSTGAFHQNFPALSDALNVLQRVRNKPVLEKGALRKDASYAAALRLRLDVSQLPKPFQLNALASKEWSLASEWLRWTVTP